MVTMVTQNEAEPLGRRGSLDGLPPRRSHRFVIIGFTGQLFAVRIVHIGWQRGVRQHG